MGRRKGRMCHTDVSHRSGRDNFLLEHEANLEPTWGAPSLRLEGHTGASRPLTQTRSPGVHRNTRAETGGRKESKPRMTLSFKSGGK